MFVDVILPLPLAASYTYSVPAPLTSSVAVGKRVVVQFGAKKIYTAIILAFHDENHSGVEAKEIMDVLDMAPVVTSHQLLFWRWIADYYMCTLGDVYKAALPSGMKLESETTIVLNEEFEATGPLTERENMVFNTIEREKEINILALQKACGLNSVLTVVTSLMAKGLVSVKESLRVGYRPKTEAMVKLAGDLRPDRINTLLNALQRSVKQQEMVVAYLQLSGYIEDNDVTGIEKHPVPKNLLMKKTGAATSVFNALVQKKVMVQYEVTTSRLDNDGGTGTVSEIHQLNPQQQTALDAICSSFDLRQNSPTSPTKQTLLHGVTSSGKTEVYIHLIKKYIDEGRQVLYLLPEIALTTQITDRLRQFFGNDMGVYHSKFPDAERVEVYKKQLSEKPYQLILGVRSSIFLPFKNLGLIIVDEEHEASYKQQDPAPRYHARSCAVMLAHQLGNCQVLHGTATPSVETYYNTTNGKAGYVAMTERYQNIELPEINIVDIQRLRQQKRMKGPFSQEVIDAINVALDHHEQVILFQNRRGYSQYVECRTCGWVPRCEHCDVSLTYHRFVHQMTCHYCGYTYQIPASCPSCGERDLRGIGVGTEQLEDLVSKIFPEAKVMRMDLDTAKTRKSYERIISDFSDHKADILIGTQMVTKGLDFSGVSVVCILDADSMVNYPDFRSYERAFQMLVQVSGRAGRKGGRGRVILQTRKPDHPLFEQVKNNDFIGMFEQQVAERRLFHYPPFYRLIYVYVKHRDEATVDKVAVEMAAQMRASFGLRVLGPDRPVVSRVQSLHIRKIILKVEVTSSVAKAKQILHVVHDNIHQKYKSAIIYFDVDPM